MRTSFLFENKNVFFLIIAGFFYGLSIGMAKPVLSILLREFSTSNTEVGLLMSTVGITTMFSTIPCGWLSDVIGKKHTLIVLLLVSLISDFIFATTAYVPYFLVALTFSGIVAMFGVISQALTLDSVKTQKRGISIGLIMAATNLGAIIAGPPIGGFLAQTYNIRWPFYARLLVTTFLLVTITIFIQEKRLENQSKNSAKNLRVAEKLSFSEKLKIIFTNKALLGCGLIFFGTGMWSSTLGTFFPMFCQDKLKMSIGQIGIVFSIAGIVVPITQIFAGKVSDISRTKVIIIGTIVASSAIFLISLATSILMLSLTLLMFNVFAAMKDPAVVAYAGDASTKVGTGKAIGIIYNLMYVGVFLGNIFGGFVYDSIGPGGPFYMASFFGIVGSFYVAFSAK